MNTGLVTIIIPVYNCEKYIREAVESVLAQTYKNIEIVISDNQSTDNTYKIVSEYAQKYAEKINVFRNPVNLGGGTQNILGVMPFLLQGNSEFFYFFSGDDVMYPDCIERCMKVMRDYPTTGLVMIERDEIDDGGSPIKYFPFYDRSFFCKGEDHLPVLMMSGVTVLSQVLVRVSAYRNYGIDCISDIYDIPTDWHLNFSLATVSDTVYLRKPGIAYRVHGGNETFSNIRIQLQIIEHYQMIIEFARVAKIKNHIKAFEREKEAITHFADMSLRYSTEMINAGYEDTAKDYLDWACIFNPDIESDSTYILLLDYLYGSVDINKDELQKTISKLKTSKRTVSYAPPGNFIEFEEKTV